MSITVASTIVTNLEIVRNYLQTMDTDSKSQPWPRNLKIDSQHSSEKSTDAFILILISGYESWIMVRSAGRDH
ncbi:hypothetical protein PIB30_010431 [Stylosanthes scabra]|uniref:Uncharacterized protein n=1 Tax=Stylosanthes scabra TaxID=79078 RepID=A0ABU6X2W9_9FABA|nr:hypothetical protein [Stylosanthes scabra]